jgi:predicted amidohydrolase
MLETAIADSNSEGRSVENALIVLPEAFNIRKPYYDRQQSPNVDLAILCELSRVSNDSHCAFVAGLIIEDTPGVSPPYSSAYLVDGCYPIDGSHHKLLSRKRKKDGTEEGNLSWVANYTPCLSYGSTPIQYRGLAVAALICLDAQLDGETGEDYDQRCKDVAKILRGFGCRHSVMCVPAHMSNGFLGGEVGRDATLRNSLEGTIHVLANSNSGGVPSFVSNVKGTIIAPTVMGNENRIEVFSFETLATVGC